MKKLMMIAACFMLLVSCQKSQSQQVQPMNALAVINAGVYPFVTDSAIYVSVSMAAGSYYGVKGSMVSADMYFEFVGSTATLNTQSVALIPEGGNYQGFLRLCVPHDIYQGGAEPNMRTFNQYKRTTNVIRVTINRDQTGLRDFDSVNAVVFTLKIPYKGTWSKTSKVYLRDTRAKSNPMKSNWSYPGGYNQIFKAI